MAVMCFDRPRQCCQSQVSCSHTSQVSLSLMIMLIVYRGHLYRHHMIYPCQRCKEVFRSQEAVRLHLTRTQGCELRDVQIGDGITNEIVEQLKCKKKTHRGETEEDRWQKIYALLFPGASLPSPCKCASPSPFYVWLLPVSNHLTLVR